MDFINSDFGTAAVINGDNCQNPDFSNQLSTKSEDVTTAMAECLKSCWPGGHQCTLVLGHYGSHVCAQGHQWD